MYGLSNADKTMTLRLTALELEKVKLLAAATPDRQAYRDSMSNSKLVRLLIREEFKRRGFKHEAAKPKRKR